MRTSACRPIAKGPAVDGADFRFDVRETRGGPLVVLTGELDISTAVELRECLVSLVGRRVTLDFSGVTFMDCTTIGVLVAARNRSDAVGAELVLQNVGSSEMRLLEITGVAAHLDVHGGRAPDPLGEATESPGGT